MADLLMRDVAGLVFIDRAVAKDGRGDELVALLRDGAGLMTAREPGLLAVMIAVSPSDPNLVCLYWHYASEAAHEAHRADIERLPEYEDMRAHLGELLAEPLAVERFSAVAGFQRGDLGERH